MIYMDDLQLFPGPEVSDSNSEAIYRIVQGKIQ